MTVTRRHAIGVAWSVPTVAAISAAPSASASGAFVLRGVLVSTVAPSSPSARSARSAQAARPLPGEIVSLGSTLGLHLTTQTDAEGRYEFTVVNPEPNAMYQVVWEGGYRAGLWYPLIASPMVLLPSGSSTGTLTTVDLRSSGEPTEQVHVIVVGSPRHTYGMRVEVYRGDVSGFDLDALDSRRLMMWTSLGDASDGRVDCPVGINTVVSGTENAFGDRFTRSALVIEVVAGVANEFAMTVS